MTDLDLTTIKARAGRVASAEHFGTDFCAQALGLSMDVPALIAEIERLERLLVADPFPTSDGYENAMQALTDMRGLVIEMLRHFPKITDPDLRDTVRSDEVPAVTVARWHRIAGGSGG